MSFSIKQTFFADGWAGFNSDLLRAYFFAPLTFKELCAITTVCKSWFKNIADNSTGQNHCKLIGIEITEEYSWMSEYRKYLSIPQIISLDVTGSMDHQLLNDKLKTRSEVAIEIIKTICGKIEEKIIYRGISCLAFDKRVSMKKCYNYTDVINFFIDDYDDEKYVDSDSHQYIGIGRSKYTSFHKLFKMLNKIQNEIEIEEPSLISQITLISDFDAKTRFELLNETNLSMQCINVGDARDVENFMSQYDTWTSKEIERKKKESMTNKRKGDDLPQEYEMSLNVVNVNVDSWLPLQKKRKISIL
jgi:hypothetical protein